jgi:hypothetical protein
MFLRILLAALDIGGEDTECFGHEPKETRTACGDDAVSLAFAGFLFLSSFPCPPLFTGEEAAQWRD